MAENQVLTLARQYAAAVRSAMEAKDIYLYGSQVKGTATQDSDIDIAVVVDRVPGDYPEYHGFTMEVGACGKP